MHEPLVKFDFNQKVYVFTDDEDVTYIPCTPLDETCFISRIPDKSWITYRGLARYYGQVYMRFLYEGEQVYVSPIMLPYLEDIQQRKPGEKLRTVPKGSKKNRKKKAKRKFVTLKTRRALLGTSAKRKRRRK